MKSAIRDVAAPRLTGWGGRLGARVGTPTALAISVFGLVVAMGALTTITSYQSLRRAGEQRAEDALAARTAQLKTSLNQVLHASDALLDQLAFHARRAVPGDAEALFAPMRELAAVRPGLTWMSVSFVDGTFVGVTLEDEGKIEGVLSRVGPAGGERTEFHFSDRGRERGETTVTDYDPRRRSFYQLAAAKRRRVWTPPYPFFATNRTGVSRVEPLYGADGALHAVLTVDFDTSGLALLLDRPAIARQRELVLAEDGSVLAAWGVALPDMRNSAGERALSLAMLDDSVLRAASSALRSERLASVNAEGEPWRVEQVRLADLEGMPIRLLSVVPEQELFERAHRAARRGLAGIAVGSLLAVFLAWILASHIARLRAGRAQAEREAERARAAATELGSYLLIAPLGAGGMGEVYRARHKLLARDAALKLIRSTPADPEDEAARATLFFEEAKTLASMRSVHTVAVYDFGIADDGRYFLAMELLDGMDLETLVRRYGPQPPARVASILAQACESLAEAHAAGLVHRDIKPANLFLCRLAGWLDVVKVLDFGLTRAVGQGGRGDSIDGTPSYMAPEQALGEALGPTSDLYCLGCVGYWLLTGCAPYELDDAKALMDAHVNAPLPELPRAIRARTPPALINLITRCMAKDPGHRPVSSALLGELFDRVAAECAETFTPAMRAAFWNDQGAPLATPLRGEQTVPRLSVRDRAAPLKAS